MTVGWEHAESEWDDVSLGGHRLPGIWALDLAPECNIDVKKGSGRDGGRTVNKGLQLAEVECSGQITSDEVPAWKAVIRKIHPPKLGGKHKPVSVRAPNASLMGVKHVTIRSVSGIKIDAKGLGTVRIRAVQWVAKPKKVKKTGAPSTDASGANNLAYKKRPWLGPYELFGDDYRDVDAEVRALADAAEGGDSRDILFSDTQEEYAQMTRVSG